MAIHPHGSLARYRQSCRCNLCVLVHENPVKRAPDPKAVPAGPVRDHIAALRAAGWSVKALAERSGYSAMTIRNIQDGKTRTTSPFLAEDILSIAVEVPA